MSRSNIQKQTESLNKLETVASIARAAGSTQMNEELTAKLNRALEKIINDLEEDELSAEEVKRHFQEIAQQTKREREESQANCRHVKEKGETALGGQRVGVAPNQQIVLVCSRCQKDFWHPAKEGQSPVPAHLTPDANTIGGRLS